MTAPIGKGTEFGCLLRKRAKITLEKQQQTNLLKIVSTLHKILADTWLLSAPIHVGCPEG